MNAANVNANASMESAAPSDEQIREDIQHKLTNRGGLDLSHIKVSVKEGDVTLRGQIESLQSKFSIEELVSEVAGVKDIFNELNTDETDQDKATL